jgi:predicted Zn-dependent protease
MGQRHGGSNEIVARAGSLAGWRRAEPFRGTCDRHPACEATTTRVRRLVEPRLIHMGIVVPFDRVRRQIAKLRVGCARTPRSPGAHASLAQALLSAGETAKAAAVLVDARNLLDAAGLGALAISTAERIAFLNPARTDNLMWLARRQLSLRNGPRALGALERLYRVDERNPIVVTMIAQAFYLHGHLDTAMLAAKYALQLARARGLTSKASEIETLVVEIERSG